MSWCNYLSIYKHNCITIYLYFYLGWTMADNMWGGVPFQLPSKTAIKYLGRAVKVKVSFLAIYIWILSLSIKKYPYAIDNFFFSINCYYLFVSIYQTNLLSIYNHSIYIFNHYLSISSFFIHLSFYLIIKIHVLSM